MKRPKPNRYIVMNYLSVKKTPVNSLLLLEVMAINTPSRFSLSEYINADGSEYFMVCHFQGEDFSRTILNYINDNNIFKTIKTFTGLPTE